MVTDYLQRTSGTCRYSFSKLKDVLYLVSAEHVKDVHIDNGEAYIDGLTELPLRINGFNIQFTEEASLDERYKFQKTLTLSMHGYVNYKAFGGRFYAIIESEDGTFFMVNVDFPSRITHTFNLSQNTNQTDFTFACLSNFPTLRLTNEFEAVSPVCLGLNVYGIDKLQLLEKENALLDVENRAVKTTESLKTVEFLGKSCSFQEVYDGNKVTDTITFNIAFDNYKPSWQWNLLEFLENKYVAIITPKGNDNKYYVGFNFGLSPSYTIQTSTEAGASDVITVTMVETSIYGSTAAVDWTDEQTTETQWRYIKNVGGTICYECIGLGRARYLVKQEVNAFGVPTGNYQVMEGYESEYPNFHIVGTFSDDVEFDNADCTSGDVCRILTTMPQRISFSEATRYIYNLETTCDWNITNIPDYISVSPRSGNANTNYEILVANALTPTSTPVEGSMQINCCRQSRTINIKVQTPQPCISPITNYVNCKEQSVAFIYDGDCQIKVIGIDPQLTYTIQNNRLLVNIPKNDTYSAHTWNIGVSGCSCPSSGVSIHIVQNRIYDEWIEEQDYMCESGNSYAIERRYTATTYAATSYTRTNETRKGSLIQSGDTRCGTVITKWEWDEESYYCIDGDKYKAIFEYISYDNGSTWTKTDNTTLGDMVESGSSWCENAVTYSWVLTDKYDCSGYTSYYLYKKYETRDGNTIPCYPAIYSIDGDNSMSLVKKKDNDEGCGYVPPITPLYRWVNLNISTDYICDDCSEPIPPFDGKVKLSYSGGTSYSAECDSITTLYDSDVTPSGYTFTEMTGAEIGGCVTSIGGWTFYGATSLTSIDIPDSVTSIGDRAFHSCTSLQNIDIPYSVTSIGNWAFRDCESLQSVTIPDSITSIGDNAFEYCNSMTSVEIGNGITNIGNDVFASCTSLTGISIPSGVTSIGSGAFEECTSLQNIDIPYSVTNIGNWAFDGCESLQSITVNAVTPPTLGTGVFNSTNECPIYVPAESVENYKYEWTDYGSRITAIQ